MRGLRALFRPVDDFEWELLVAEMRAGVVEWVPEWARIGYLILWHYCDGELGVEPPEWVEWVGHPMKYLASVIRVQGSCSRWPTLVVSAYEELDHESPERND